MLNIFSYNFVHLASLEKLTPLSIFNEVCIFLLLSYRSPFYILEINTLSDI